MSKTTVPADSDFCRWFSAVSAGDVVLATSPSDYVVPTPCELGAMIAAGPVSTDPNYDLVVLDTEDYCLKRYDKPAIVAYDTTVLRPWSAGAGGQNTYSITWNSDTDGLLAEIALPVFDVDVYIHAVFSLQMRSAQAGYNVLIGWFPYGPNAAGTACEPTIPGRIVLSTSSNAYYYSSGYVKRYFMKANTSGLKIGINMKSFTTQVGIDAIPNVSVIAFKKWD